MKLSRRSLLLGSAATFLSPAAPLLARQRQVGGAGLSASIEILDDPYGVPHIRARSIPDAYFGQGYVVARDRLFQIDLAQRREMGRLAEVFGAEFAAHDAAARLFHYHGDVHAELARVPARYLDCARAYVAGVNARIDEVVANPALLPLEYRILGIRPMRWALRDLVVARGASGGNSGDEVRRARLAAMGLLEVDEIAAPLHPAWKLSVPEGLDAAAVSDADLGVLRLGGLPYASMTPDPVERANAGSNAWTVGPDRTATGRPILANDPHLGIGGFGPRHVAHLTAPGLDVIGAGAPGLPGIMQGHTDRFAFGRTNFHIDQEDLFVLVLNAEDHERYWHDGGWKRFETVETLIPVKGAAAKAVTLRYSVHGPVLSHDPARRRATALASIELQPGASGAFAMIAINLARDWESLRAAFAFHPSPTNFHYADVEGNHGWQVIGFTPVRRKGDGLLPVPGDGRYDWTGMRDFRALPSEFNPAKGWFASANQNNLPADWPRDRIPAFSFREPYRYERIAEVLAGQPKHNLADSVALQHDTMSAPARQLIALLPGQAGPAAEMLRGWDGRIDAASGAAALFEILWRELNGRMVEAIVPARARGLIDSVAPSVLLERLASNPALLERALATAWNSALTKLGPDPAAWRWGAQHRVRLMHPLSSVPAIAAAFPAIEGEESGGDSYTVMARGIRGAQVGSGASYLQVIDVGGWDNSLMLNLPGQSNDPRSRHYRDHYGPWSRGQMLPMLFSKAAVDARVVTRTTLNPARE
ncbi:MAG: penicillin acylase family protein [Sphingomonas sp.]|uniref:penicillin acylase family protein n=1 Tax=Sphingomonas sp. TaxID=28214 RepID=UPI0025E045CA|nr:penicillin acylase family protein [Sphingomonas sp.]MBX3565157.1 penicillin acylase family protein [Sphingomonas sp.]